MHRRKPFVADSLPGEEWREEYGVWFRIQETMVFAAVLVFLGSLVGAGVVLGVAAGSDTCKALPEYDGHVVNGSSGLPAPGLRVAFLGDQGNGAGARAVLRLMRQERVDLVFHAGDLSYDRSPGRWSRMVRRELWTEDYRPPYFVSLGNHDIAPFSPGRGADYARRAMEMHPEAAGCCCEGRVGARAVCAYRGLAVIQSARGLTCEDNGGTWVRKTFQRLERWPWRVCLFHVLQEGMQIEGKRNEAGWGIYEACREAGALIINGHSHVYSRTHLMSSMRGGTVVHRNATMRLQPGHTLAAVVGLGGHSIRSAKQRLRERPHWARTLAAGDPDVAFGALFCHFVTSERAECCFKTVEGKVIDEFVLIQN